MKQFFKFMFASIFGFFISIFLISVLFFFMIFGIASSLQTEETVEISKNSILSLNFNYEIPERTSQLLYFEFTKVPSIKKTLGLNDIKKIIEHAKTDEKIKGVFLNLDNYNAGNITVTNIIRNSLEDFKNSGKFIIAHGNSITEQAFYLGSIADSIFLTPTGGLEFDGFNLSGMFVKKMLNKLDIEPQIFKYGKFKGATEIFSQEKFSEANRKQSEEYLNSIYDNFLTAISKSINKDKDELKNIASDLKINSAEDAKNYQFVDELLYRDKVDTIICDLLNTDDEIKYVTANEYLNSTQGSKFSTSNRIAIIYALGNIVEGNGNETTIGTKNIIQAIRKAKNNSRVKAIVMRVNSPGGSALTSDMIWREIKLVSEEKPFIVSMGPVAASGGYYISCSADKIVAEPTTLTGSIGVFGIIPNFEKFMSNKLGVTFDYIKTNKNAGIYEVTAPLNPTQKNYIQTQVNNTYKDFVARVAEGRNMSFAQVDEFAQGRIWSGIDAKEIGLVDTLGGIDLALNIAAKKANIKNYRIIEYPKQKEPFEKILEMFATKVKVSFSDFTNDRTYKKLKTIEEVLQYTGIQARLPIEYKIN
ncbi:MAG: signal peptide peptidase SppA [Ignavibacteriae bacterium]|nr:MAG: signal peptide peptidase SppA [Ignavibacteriota bacterium]